MGEDLRHRTDDTAQLIASLKKGYLEATAALAEERERAEKAEAITSALTWLIAAGVQVTIGACNHQGGAELRVAIDLDDDPAWYGDLSACLADAKTYCSAQGVEP